MKHLIFIILVGLSSLGLAQTSDKASEPGVTTDAKNFKEIFESNLKQSQISLYAMRPKYAMGFSVANSDPRGTFFTNDYYEIAYDEQVKSLSTFSFYAEQTLENKKAFFLKPMLGLSYTFEEKILLVRAKSGGLYKDVLKFQSIPLFIGSKFGYRASLPVISSVFASLGLAYEWVVITGTLDGINQSYWSPGYLTTVGATFFEPENQDLNSWFGGLTLSAGAQRSLSAKGKGSSANRLELGMSFLL